MNMSSKEIAITPKTKIKELLDAFPELEEVLIKISPAFAKLQNPILRRTVARVATLQQAAAIGGIAVDELVNQLREACHLEVVEDEIASNNYFSIEPPDWFSEDLIHSRFNATPIINAGGSPMAEILQFIKDLPKEKIFELSTPFLPAPIIDMLVAKGFLVYCIQKETVFYSYFIHS